MVTTPPGDRQASMADSEEAPPRLGEALEYVFERMQSADLEFGHGTDNAWDESVALVLTAADMPPDAGEEVLEETLSTEQWATMRRWLAARIDERMPLPYVTGKAWFAGLLFRCDQRALVPRSPLGEVIQNDYAPWWTGPPPDRILDLCCGGGAIGIAAAAHDDQVHVVLCDIDEDALDLAAENVTAYGLEERVTIRQGDLFSAVPGERFDLILSNPPYVDARDLAAMPREFHREPPRGLGSGDDGLDMARRILTEAADYLTPDGLLFLEVGNSWEALDDLLQDQALTWLEFSRGGHGVLMVSAAELPALRDALARR